MAAAESRRICARRRVLLDRAPMAAALLGSLGGATVEAQSSVDVSYLYYSEDRGRVQVLNPMLMVHQDLGPKGGLLDLKLSYDAVSGASPTGAYPGSQTTTSASQGGAGTIPLVQFQDRRKSGSISYSHLLGSHLPSINLSHSEEKDYFANGFGVSDVWTLGEGRNTIHYGASYSHDLVEPVTNHLHLPKRTRSFAAGWTFILGENDLIDLSATRNLESGYLDEPYLVVPVGTATMPDHRPDHITQQAYLVKYGHYFPIRGALKLSYRYYTDDWSIRSSTEEVVYDQRVGARWILSPSLRFYTQSAAYFYGTSFATPQPYLTADYRLSDMGSSQAGFAVTCETGKTFSIRLGATFQWQRGRDRVQTLIPDPEGENPPTLGPSVSAADLNTRTVTLGLKWRY